MLARALTGACPLTEALFEFQLHGSAGLEDTALLMKGEFYYLNINILEGSRQLGIRT